MTSVRRPRAQVLAALVQHGFQRVCAVASPAEIYKRNIARSHSHGGGLAAHQDADGSETYPRQGLTLCTHPPLTVHALPTAYTCTLLTVARALCVRVRVCVRARV